MTLHFAQRHVSITNHRCLQRSPVGHPPPWLPLKIRSSLLRRQNTKTATHSHILHVVPTLATRELGAERFQKVVIDVIGENAETDGIEGIEGMGQVEQVGVGLTEREKSGVRSGRMFIRLPFYFHPH